MQFIQDSRIISKQFTTAGVVATIPISGDHTDGLWLYTDLYIGETAINVTDEIIFHRTVGGIIAIPIGGLATIKKKIVTVSSAEILLFFATPKVIVPAAGAGVYIDVISSVIKNTFNTVAYAGSGLVLKHRTGGTIHKYNDALFTATSSVLYKGIAETTSPLLKFNEDLVITTGANPTLGNSTFTVEVIYRETTGL